ncbi:uncharacterized protein ACWYII_043144 isoform 1-T3 [Salvelinus alpinus]
MCGVSVVLCVRCVWLSWPPCLLSSWRTCCGGQVHPALHLLLRCPRGCPLILTDMDVVEKSESLSKPSREFLFGLLFHTINWFREVVNAFCSQKEPEMKMKVVTRLQNITYLQTLLDRTLAEIPGYAPPLANFDGESTEGAPVSSSTVVPKKGKKIYIFKAFPEMRFNTYCGGYLAEGTGNKRKAPAKNSAADSSQLEEGTEAEETQQRRRRFRRPAGQGSVLCPTVPSSGSWTWRCCSVACSPGSLLDSELHSKALRALTCNRRALRTSLCPAAAYPLHSPGELPQSLPDSAV